MAGIKRILGIDPGFGRMGFGIIDVACGKMEMVNYGCWETHKGEEFSERIFCLIKLLRKLIKKYRPTAVALEELFFFKNLKTAINVAQARGAVMLQIKESKLPLVELTPLQVKQSLTSYGRADKKQMQKMVQVILKIKEIPKPDDAADALAIAIAAVPYLNQCC
ncbi:MAG TPA: crossover junction endodeoxyribonuclease RuvC [Candidatus Magasanikbacteria bacterium]|uniref:Crossover junction endodeoxyribonuclease RuvC n=1 Tax=Candidatus Magasanikbacteria bacterium GW2011_GWC2_41_17 TaxID=1619048 RepID=A0A0G0YHU5_9BACT|nr:MAG: Crossover junction endodeoxyribonuclease RuvC [Candidatus Magasanikbacteria bacterium GW2011_GWC2_41_17]HBV57744.1 crossover junction endodeoxyribonuclease RuvC [Candidatus Magasanikbacteria bacterium]HBX16383.1 crossover junction endodeoxyribonuclease RuvC [Candidatus Magasanikbacteria bacterium]